MKKNSIKKLSLNSNTIANLNGDALSHVIGGGTVGGTATQVGCNTLGCPSVKCAPTPTDGCATHG